MLENKLKERRLKGKERKLKNRLALKLKEKKLKKKLKG